MTKTTRRYLGMRVTEDFYARLAAIAEKQKTSVRAVFEQLAEKGLPELERAHGITPAKPKTGKHSHG
jgi:hypothetical protein